MTAGTNKYYIGESSAVLRAALAEDIPALFAGGSGLTLTDGTNTVAGATHLAVTGATVGGTSPNATLAISGSGSGTVSDITSTGGSITITNPTGPTVNLEVTTPGGTGTVTSVSLTDASANPIFNTGGSGTTAVALTETLKTQAANTIFAGPTTGAAAQPAFRAMVIADLPTFTPLQNFNLIVDDHASLPTGVGAGPNDEFEQSAGTAVDTAGTRYSGATAWTAFNLGTGSTSQSGSGTLLFTPQVGAGVFYSGYTQPVPASGNYTYLMKVSAAILTSSQLLGMLVATSSGASGHIYLFGASVNAITAQRATNSTTFSSNPAIIAWNNTLGTSPGTTGYVYLQFNWNAGTTTLTASMSLTGAPGTFLTLITETAAAFLGTPALIGFGAQNQASANAVAAVDFFRRTA